MLIILGLGLPFYPIQQANSYLDKADSMMSNIFLNLSGDFNIIKPALVCEELHKLKMYSLDYWLCDKLTTVS